MSGPGRAFDKCLGRAGLPGSHWVAGRGSLISLGGRGSRVAGRRPPHTTLRAARRVKGRVGATVGC